MVVGNTLSVGVGVEHFTEGSVEVRKYGACDSAAAFCVRATVRLGGNNSCASSVVVGERGFSN